MLSPEKHASAAAFSGRSIDYLMWREHRLRLQDNWHANTALQQPLELSPALDTAADQAALQRLCEHVRDYGFACYQWTAKSANTEADVARLHSALSLQTLDSGVLQEDNGLSLLTDLSGTERGRFIPYTARKMSWHTDGYYNAPAQSLGSFTLHCVQPAASGGALSLADDRLLLIALLDEDPHLVQLLTHAGAMTIPANTDTLGHDRPDRTSPVFFTRKSGAVGTHYTTRTRNIEWRTPDTQAAAARIAELLAQRTDWQHTVRLQAGQGVITRNIVHRREAFADDPATAPRQMLRGRYLQSPTLVPRQH